MVQRKNDHTGGHKVFSSCAALRKRSPLVHNMHSEPEFDGLKSMAKFSRHEHVTTVTDILIKDSQPH